MSIFLTGLVLGPWTAPVPAGADAPAAKEYEGFLLTAFEMQGVPGALAGDLEKGLALATERKLFKTSSIVFRAADLDADVARTKLFLARRGYPEARVAARIDPGKGRRIRVVLQVAPGPPVLVESVDLAGYPGEPDKPLRKSLAAARGAVFSEEEIEAVAARIQASLHHAGYARASVKAQAVPIGKSRVRVQMAVDPGASYRFGATRVSGIPEDLVPLAVRTIDIPPGTPYSPRTLRNSQDNLRLLDLFRQIRLTTVPAGPETLDVVAELTARAPHTVETRAGYLSEDLFRARVRWTGHNTFSGGRGLEGSATYSQFHQEVRASTWWPALIGPRTREILTLRASFDKEDAYTQRSLGTEFATWYRRSFYTTYRLYVQFGYFNADFVSEEEADFEGLMTILGASWSWDSTDDRLRPTRGLVTWAEVDYAPEFLPAESPFIRGEVGGSIYFPLPRTVVLAQRLVLGAANPLRGDTQLLPTVRFYAGGINSNRGFERRRLGPLFPSGDPAGGESKIESMTEVRFPLVWKFRGAVFLDVGQVWPRVEDIVLDQIEPSAGWALMIDTPVGPLRVDMGYRLGDSGSEPASVFHFLIGHPF